MFRIRVYVYRPTELDLNNGKIENWTYQADDIFRFAISSALLAILWVFMCRHMKNGRT